MRIASYIVGITPGSNVFRDFIGWENLIDCGFAPRFDTVYNQLDLVLAITNRPVASSFANNIDQLEE
jgi:hypothetical protein